MQSVIRHNPNVHPLLDSIDAFYSIVSERDVKQQGLLRPVFDSSFSSLLDAFSTYGFESYPVDLADITYEEMPKIPCSHDIILAFSGGKDSIASAIKYRNEGKNVHLYHLRHINPSFSDEWERAVECATLLGMPIFVDDISFKGKHAWMEHPMKNMLIANGMLSYGIREGTGTNLAFGNYYTSLLQDNAFDRCAGDCVDMWDTYTAIVRRIIPEFKISINLENMGETLRIIGDYPKLLDNSLSCLCRHSLRPYRHQWVKDKFGVDLLKYRCGSCYKCCVEYIYLADHDKIEFSEDYYKYCLSQLYKVTREEWTGVRTMEGLWNNYLFYPVEKSKMYETLKDTRVRAGGIYWDEGRQ